MVRGSTSSRTSTRSARRASRSRMAFPLSRLAVVTTPIFNPRRRAQDQKSGTPGSGRRVFSASSRNSRLFASYSWRRPCRSTSPRGNRSSSRRWRRRHSLTKLSQVGALILKPRRAFRPRSMMQRRAVAKRSIDVEEQRGEIGKDPFTHRRRIPKDGSRARFPASARGSARSRRTSRHDISSWRERTMPGEYARRSAAATLAARYENRGPTVRRRGSHAPCHPLRACCAVRALPGGRSPARRPRHGIGLHDPREPG